MSDPPQLLLGIDGGGSTTSAWLAPADATGMPQPLGRGVAGPSNPQSVGWETALANLSKSVDAAFADARLPRTPVHSACVALAGGDRDEARRRLRDWADHSNLAQNFLPAHDALALLAAGTPHGTGIALVAGTGSFAFGQTPDARTARAGGWGYLFGDEGSGYAIALAGLRAVAAEIDDRGPATSLSKHFFKRLEVAHPDELIPAVYPHATDRQWVAALAELVLCEAQAADAVALQIIQQAADDLASIVQAVARKLDCNPQDLPLALGGSLLLHSQELCQALLQHLFEDAPHDAHVRHVADPVAGAVILARNLS